MKKIFFFVVFVSVLASCGCLCGTGSKTEATSSGVSTTAPAGGILSNFNLLKSGVAMKCKYSMEDTDAIIYMKGDKIRVEAKSKNETMVMIVKTLPNGSSELNMQVPGYSGTWLKLIVPESQKDEEAAGGAQAAGIDLALDDLTEMRKVLDDLDCSTASVGDDYFELPAGAKVIEDLTELIMYEGARH